MFIDLPRDEQAKVRAAVKAAIAAELQANGGGNWDALMARPDLAPHFKTVSDRRRFFNWLKAVKNPTPVDTTRPHTDREETNRHQAWSKEQAKAFTDAGHSMASPRMVQRYGRRIYDLEAEARQMLADADALRLHATTPDPSGPMGFRIVDIKSFQAASAMRNDALRRLTELQAQRLEFEDLEHLHDGILALVDAALAEFPDLQRQMYEGLQTIAEGGEPGAEPDGAQ